MVKNCGFSFIHRDDMWDITTLACSNCATQYDDHFHATLENWKYCPNCGALIQSNYLGKFAAKVYTCNDKRGSI